MTAEIAILNKSAVALATDSAVTISSGSRSHKMFDSGDKLFELSDRCPIGVMVNNAMDFVGIPISSLIRKFRSQRKSFLTIEDAAKDFVDFLNLEGKKAPESVKDEYVFSIARFFAEEINKRVGAQWSNNVTDIVKKHKDGDDFAEFIKIEMQNIWEHQLSVFETMVRRIEVAQFADRDNPPPLPESDREKISSILSEQDVPVDLIQRAIDEVIYPYVIGSAFADSHTGIIVAGFGTDELFPTLVSLKIEGMVLGALKYLREDAVDIDREGRRAAVIPFAQRDMVDRFIYGFDKQIQNDISGFCDQNLTEFKTGVVELIEFEDDEDRSAFEERWQSLQDKFMESLRRDAFEAVRGKTQALVEDMVEFMPKPELARMAEALIEVTSLKRRVTEGMETVAGPIDVAVISQSEGFVWVKRKHYFSPSLNPRYAIRVAEQLKPQGDGGEPNV